MISKDKLKQIAKISPLILAGISFLFWVSLQEENNEIHSARLNTINAPDLTLINTTTQHYDETGHQQYHLTALKIDHYKDERKATFKNPKLESIKANSTWSVTAEQGQADLNSDIIVLKNQVRIEKESNTKKTTLRTSELSIDTHRKIADNNVLTVIHTGNSYIESKGFQTNFDTDETVLKENVRGTYDVQQ